MECALLRSIDLTMQLDQRSFFRESQEFIVMLLKGISCVSGHLSRKMYEGNAEYAGRAQCLFDKSRRKGGLK